MQKTIYISFIGLLFLLSGCIKEDMDDCPAPIHLTFLYKADGEKNVIDSYIHTAQLYIYDECDKLYTTLSLTKEQLTHKGIHLNLPFGKYTLVSWGNANEQTEITQTESLNTGRVSTPGFNKQLEIPTNDPLYQGHLEIVVEEPVKQTKTKQEILEFYSAHIRLEVYVRSKSTPQVLIHHLMPEYNLMKEETQPYETTYTPTMNYREDNKIYEALLQVYRFKNDNPIQVEVSIPGASQTSQLTIDLADYMAEQMPPLLVEGIQEITIPLLFEFSELGVICKFPEWIAEPTYPGVQ